jgi:hypothetical protein
MKITEGQLRKIIREEISKKNSLNESVDAQSVQDMLHLAGLLSSSGTVAAIASEYGADVAAAVVSLLGKLKGSSPVSDAGAGIADTAAEKKFYR